ncbi:MAG TPA: hypothetical protein EYO58_05310 [Flavobacteriales bacterium]|nr:hypothetical protein [Flavobacteriales bacterium]
MGECSVYADVDGLANALMVLCCSVISWAAIVYLAPKKSASFSLRLFFSAFLVRIVCVYAVYYYLVSLGASGFAFFDDSVYHRQAASLAEGSWYGNLSLGSIRTPKNPAYLWLNTSLYRMLGVDTMVPRLLNACLGALSVVVVFHILRQLVSWPMAKAGAWLMACLPNAVFWSSLQFKDTIVLFLLALVLLMLLQRRHQVAHLRILTLLGLLYLMSLFRQDLALALGLCLYYVVLRQMKVRPYAALVFGFVCIVCVGVLWSMLQGDDMALSWTHYSVYRREWLRNVTLFQADVGFMRHLKLESWLDVWRIPLSFVAMLLVPLPHVAASTKWGAAAYDLYALCNLSFVALLPIMGIGCLEIYKKWRWSFLSFILLLFPIVLCALTAALFPGVLRYKYQWTPFFIIWFACGFGVWKSYLRFLPLAYFGLAGMVVGAILLR